MEITEVRIKLMEEPGERLKAFCSITFNDAFVVRDLKIIEGSSGPFVAMPSRKLTSHCPYCGSKNHLRAAFCNQCGKRLREPVTAKDEDGRAKLYADIAHPINSACRELIQDRVIKAFEEEVAESKMPGYVSRYDEFGDELAAARASVVETTQIQPAEKPRGPHAPMTRRPATADGVVRQGSFGEGVFE
ncbi:MAG TPA: SpoVG family protein [Thermoguttaceae bacterium]|nr:SpoVG family protein [Thermoguttaceae bacterium]